MFNQYGYIQDTHLEIEQVKGEGSFLNHSARNTLILSLKTISESDESIPTEIS